MFLHVSNNDDRRACVAGLLMLVCCCVEVSGFAATFYVNGSIAASGDGSSWAQAKKTIAEGSALIPGAGEHTVMVMGDNIYREQVASPFSGVSDNQRITYEGVAGSTNGTIPIVSRATNLVEADFVLTGGQTKTYEIAEASTISGVWESTNLLSHSWVAYAERGNVADVEANPASYYYNAGTLYVHTSTSVSPAAGNYQLEARNNWYLFQMQDRSYITVKGFAARHAYTGIQFRTGCAYCSAISNLCYSLKYAGIWCHGESHHSIVSNNVCNAIGALGIYMIGTNQIVCHNVCYSNLSHGVYSSQASHSEFRDNICYGNTNGFYIYHNYNINSNLYYNNVLYGNVDYGIRIRYAPSNWFFNNTIYGNGDGGINFSGNGSSNCVVFNNIVWQDGAGACIYIFAANDKPGFRSDYNDLHATGGASVGNWVGYVDFAGWCAADANTDDATHSVSQDPRFVDLLSNPKDLSILRLSPCFNRGTPSLGGQNAPATDIDARSRPVAGFYDIGAYEFFRPRGTVIAVK